MIRNLIKLAVWLILVLVLTMPAIAIDKGPPQPVKNVQPLQGFDRHWPDGCYSLYYFQNVTYLWNAPHPGYGDWAYAERFTTPKPARLLSVDIPIYDPGDGTFGNDDVYITIYDDNAGFPGTELAACTLLAGTYLAYPYTERADFQKFNLVLDGDFHIAFSSSAVYGSGDYESCLSDDESTPLGRSSSIWDAAMGWVDMLSGWGVDVDFVMFANLCDVSPCVAYGDCNNDGIFPSAADMSYLGVYVASNPAPRPLMWQCDMNGDCVTDSFDVLAYTEYFISGMSAFDKYGGYPVHTCCGDSAHKMHYPQLPDETGWDVNATAPVILADDWQCSETGYVKDIHFWGSWRDGLEGVIDSFSLSIHTDIPSSYCYADGDCNNDGLFNMNDMTYLIAYIYSGGPDPNPWYSVDMNGDCEIDLVDVTLLSDYMSGGDLSIFDPYGGYPVPTCCEPGVSGYSRPGTTLRDWYVSDFEIIPIDPPTLEGWYDPLTNDIRGNNHQAYFQYNVFLDTSDWFWQDEGTIYWLNISAIIEDTTYQWGWKSSINHWNDDAVWAQWGTLDWVEMYEPEQPTIIDSFGLMLDSFGEVSEWWGTGYYGEGWYTYPSGWINMWFYDHPFDSTRYKDITISFNVQSINPAESSYVEIAVNWSTDWWSLEGNPLPEDRRPPLPGDDEVAFIGRYTHLSGHDIEGSYTFDFNIPEYNPEWVSIDIQGENVNIENGEIRHECKSYEPVSLDLSFVITGDSLPPSSPTGACCYDDGTGLQSGCTVTTQDSCETILGGVYMGDGSSCMGIEACCLNDGTCINADAWCCEVILGGVPQGPGSVCSAQLTACCMPDNTCQILDSLCCIQLGGIPQASQVCGTNQACCLSTGDCIMADSICCIEELGGTPQGTGTACSAATIACCLPNGTCRDVDPLCCDELGGTPSPMGAPACLGDVDLDGVDDACENPLEEHKMHYPQWPDETGWDVNATYPLVLADDWECSETGYVKDVHFWGSWKHGFEGIIDSFKVSIHSDIPYELPMYPYSRPGELLWDRYISDFTTTSIWPDTWEGWYDPETGDTFYNDHQEYFRYDIYLDSTDWFEQDSGTVYWLDISGFISGSAVWGWKSSYNHWNDDAVWGHVGMDNWVDLYEPGGATSTPIVNEFNITMAYGEPLDWGGTDYYGAGWYYYPSGWWNMWFYDHPYDSTRYKNITMEFDLDVYDLAESSYVEIAFNWSTDWWSTVGNHPGDPRVPPLSGDDEMLGIGRETVLAGDADLLHGHHVFEYVIENYNPEWVSIDVRGDNFIITNGTITHECISDAPAQSLDLSFVITGEPPRPPFRWWHHYRGVDDDPDYDTCTSGFLTVWGTVNCDTTGHDPIFADTTHKCITYGGLVPDWANDILWNFKWHCFCHNNDWFKLAAPTYVGDKWVLENLGDWWDERYYSSGVEQIIMPSIGDITGAIGTIYYVVDLEVWLAATPRNWQDTYEIVDGECDDLPGYYFSLTPILFDEFAPPDRGTGPFTGTNLTGTLYLDGEVTAGNSLPAVCGDANGDETINVGDAVYMINYVFKGGTAPDPECSGDANGDATLNVGDAVWLINYVFKSGPAPIEPCCP
ncbi:MAG: hypothetical protein GY841_19245 [FCB group bacterium]|nr:hypothetical protein [FCB group bacterium]